MSTAEGRAGFTGDLKRVVDHWAASLAQVLESMTGQRPEVAWREVTGRMADIGVPDGAGVEEMLWWEQPFDLSPDAVLWVGAPRPAWEYAATITLRAAGLDSVDTGEARNTWLEILGQSLSAMARGTAAVVGREVVCRAGVERAPDPQSEHWLSVGLTFAEAALAPLLLNFHPKLIQHILAPHAAPEPEPRRDETHMTNSPRAEGPRKTASSRTMDLLLDVDLPVSISFGKARLPLKDVLKLTTGSIVELNRGINEPVDILVNDHLVARGEIVVVEGNYGVRIQELATRQDRLRSIG